MGQAGRVGKVRVSRIGAIGRVNWGEAVGVEIRRAGLWLPVLMGVGIWAYFSWPVEPPVWTAAIVALPLAAALPARVRGHLWSRAVVFALVAVGAGYTLALLSAHRVAAPTVEGRTDTTVEGRVTTLDRSASEAPRVVLDRVTLFGIEPGATPDRVRVTLMETPLADAPRPGETIRVHATLLPPGDPVEPGAFDFGERAFFEGIGAVGYTRAMPARVPPAEAMRPETGGPGDRFRIWLASVRLRLSEAIRAGLPGPPGAFAAAIMVGDRVGIEEADAEALRVSSLAHLLAISGLHMGLLTGLVFAATRLLLALPARIALGYPTKKIAAVIALAAGLAYLFLSGATVATQRAFAMVAVAFLAVLFDRPAISVRGLAIAAAIVLAVRPVSLFDVGFQMSFAATLALVAGYEELRRINVARRARRAERREESPRLARRLAAMAAVWFGGLVFTSVLAGTATTPFSTYHFNRLAPYGLIANLGAVPVMGLVIAPAAIATAVAAPFGLAALPMAVMGQGIEWVLAVAHWTTALPGSDRIVQAGEASHLVLITLGGLWLALWRGVWRLAGVAPMALGTILWSVDPPERPALIVAPGGALIGLMGPEGRALDRDRGQSYAAETWLRRDGDPATQEEAARRPGLDRAGRRASGLIANGWRVEVTQETTPEPADLVRLCRPRTILIARGAREAPGGGCLFYGATTLAAAGAVAIWPAGEGVRIEESARRDPRLWNRRATIGDDAEDGGGDPG